MATSVPSAPQAAVPPRPTAPVTQQAPQAVKSATTGAGQAAPVMALVPATQAVPDSKPGIPENSPAMRLKVELEVSVPVGNFRVKNLLALEPGVVTESRWKHGEDLPLAAGHVRLAWTEFEAVDTRLAARLTRLA